jgi:hypothetical protein
MVNPSKACSTLNTFLIRIKKFGANWTLFRHGGMGGRREGGSKGKKKEARERYVTSYWLFKHKLEGS